jgi:Rho-binding antiterminator
MDRPYIPISCAVHDELLALATLRQECEIIVVLAEGHAERIRGLITDVYSRGGIEYLQLPNGGIFRLDQIQALNDQPIPST